MKKNCKIRPFTKCGALVKLKQMSIKFIKILKKLKKLGAVGVKQSLEDEGASFNDIRTMRNITKRLKLKLIEQEGLH